jgi:hypothetical protein
MTDTYFQHDYIIQNEFKADAGNLCLRCAKLIRSEKHRMIPRRNTPGDLVDVCEVVPHSDYRLVPMVVIRNNRRSMIHIPVCVDCVGFELTPKIASLIVKQISNGEVMSASWCRYPEEFLNAIRKRWERTQIIERLEGKALEDTYNLESAQVKQEAPSAS